MRRERALKVVLVVVGLIFCGLAYPLMMFVKQEPALAMMMSLYVTLGIFLIMAARNPSANRSLIAFTAWSSFAHAALMGAQAVLNLIPRGELLGVAALVIIGVALIVLAPAKSVERVSAAVASVALSENRHPHPEGKPEPQSSRRVQPNCPEPVHLIRLAASR
jgi:hypothetical protein